MTPAMRHPPSRRLEDRGRRGWWPQFPVSPQQPYDELVTRFRLTDLDAYSGDGWAAGEFADDVADRARRLETCDPSWNLAVRRALLTIGLDLVESCNDSYGHVGDTVNDAMVKAAVRLGRLDVARRTLGAADRPGPHQDLVRRTRAALGG